MGTAKQLIVKVIPASIANPFVKKMHYSGKVVNNSNLHLGVFWEGKLHGVMSFGPSLDKSKIIGLVEGTKWSEFLELNRMAFDDVLPRNSESRALAVAFRLIKKNAPHVKWIVSFADATQCGDGTIYRGSGFVLTLIKENEGLFRLPDGSTIHQLTVRSNPSKPRPELGGKSLYDVSGGTYSIKKWAELSGAQPLEGYQLRYIKFLDESYKSRLTVPIVPFSKIDEIGAGMYKGKKISQQQRHCDKE